MHYVEVDLCLSNSGLFHINKVGHMAHINKHIHEQLQNVAHADYA